MTDRKGSQLSVNCPNSNSSGHTEGCLNDIQIEKSDKPSEKITRKQAIKLKCLDCVNYVKPIIQIKSCQNTVCSLWSWRPYKTKDEKILKRKVTNNNYLEDLEKARKVKGAKK